MKQCSKVDTALGQTVTRPGEGEAGDVWSVPIMCWPFLHMVAHLTITKPRGQRG